MATIYGQAENLVWNNRQALPMAVMGISALLIAMNGEWTLFAGTLSVALTGGASYAAVKLGEVFSDLKNKTIPAADTTLKNTNDLVTKLNAVVIDLEANIPHPVEDMEESAAHVVQGAKAEVGKATQWLSALFNLTAKVKAAAGPSTPIADDPEAGRKPKNRLAGGGGSDD